MPVEPIYKVAQLPALLGCGKTTAYRLVAEGRIRSFSLTGGTRDRRVTESAINEYLAVRQAEPTGRHLRIVPPMEVA